VKIKDLAAKPLAMTTAMTAACAVSGSLATDPKSEWYKALNKPSWQPPGWLFPIVWTALYTDVAVTSAAVIKSLDAASQPQAARDFRTALAVNLVLNQGWSWAFFKAHKLLPATVVASLLAASSIDLSRRADATAKGKALALAPYAAWCTFATILTAEITRRNPRD
jgi:translocator protein